MPTEKVKTRPRFRRPRVSLAMALVLFSITAIGVRALAYLLWTPPIRPYVGLCVPLDAVGDVLYRRIHFEPGRGQSRDFLDRAPFGTLDEVVQRESHGVEHYYTAHYRLRPKGDGKIATKEMEREFEALMNFLSKSAGEDGIEDLFEDQKKKGGLQQVWLSAEDVASIRSRASRAGERD